MNTAVINIKTQPIIKEKAQNVAKELGFSLSSLVNAYLKQLIKTQTVHFSVYDDGEPTEYLLNSLKQSDEDIKNGRVSPAFSNTKDAITWLNNPKRKLQNEN